jgi:hypothetical protein
VDIVPQSASVTIEIEQMDLPSVTGRWDLEGLPPRPMGMDEPLDRAARPAVADLTRASSPTAMSSTRGTDEPPRLACPVHVLTSAAPVRGRSSGHRSHR